MEKMWVIMNMALLMMVMNLVRTEAAQYIVGDSAGWDASTFLNQWVQAKTFQVGDVLVFQYSSLHDVVEVNKQGYDSCSTTNALDTYNNGNTQISLKSAGNKYFICGTPGHCAGGMKMAVTVHPASSSSPSPSPSNFPSSASATPFKNTGKAPSTVTANNSPASSGHPHSSAPSLHSNLSAQIMGLLCGAFLALTM